MKKGTLLFYFSDEKCNSTTAVIPTLSKLAKNIGIDFETYICTRPDSWQGKVLPAIGHNHIQSFYYLANYYDRIIYCSISSYPSYQFKREVIAFGGEVISCRKDNELLEFYNDVFTFFQADIGKEAIVIPDKPSRGEMWIAPYCYPDILYSNSIGLDKSTFINNQKKLLDMGIEKVRYEYCDISSGLMSCEKLDEIKETDTYGSVTERIVKRHIDKVKGIGFCDASCMCRWNALYCREDIVTLYQDYEWEEYVETVAKYAEITKNHKILGNHVIYVKRDNAIGTTDDLITEFAKYNMYMDLLGVNPRNGFSIQIQKKLPLDWIENAKAPWEDEYSDEYLIQKLNRRATPVCFMFYAADIGHLPVIGKFLDMMSLDGMRAGIAFPSTWYQYSPELLEQIYIPLEQGGVFPNLEPVLSSLGVAVATEAKEFMPSKLLVELIQKAKDEIEAYVGKKMIPRGYYPFQDANPFYQSNTGTPPFETISKLGFEYYITYKDGGERGQIKYENNGMTVLSQQVPNWFPSAGNPIAVLKQWEKECQERREKWKKDNSVDAVDWISIGFDTPFFGLTPNYLGEIELERFRMMNNGEPLPIGMHKIYEAMQYVRHTGGDSGELFLVKPHELYRFAKLAKEMGLK